MNYKKEEGREGEEGEENNESSKLIVNQEIDQGIPKKITVISLVFMTYFYISGGPYGLEDVIYSFKKIIIFSQDC